ncbi:MAG: hypothetical protein JXR77_05730 [Lentisphaeria bacterium]|nr:hypothetical protein [Lentisphaeria bacterium]
MVQRLAILLWVALVSGGGWVSPGWAAEAAAWVHEDAAVRIRAALGGRSASQYRLDLPKPVAGTCRGVAVYVEGDKVAASPIATTGPMDAVWFAVGKHHLERRRRESKTEDLPVDIYLFAEEKVPVPLPAEYRRPARFVRATRSLVTRPFTAPEATRMMHGLSSDEGGLYRFDMTGIATTFDREQWQEPPERRSALMVWSAGVRLDSRVSARFGGSHDGVAWFVFVDGRPTADWCTAERAEGGGFWGPGTEVDAGLHQVDFFVVQRPGEPIPECLWHVEGQPAARLLGDLPLEHPEALRIELGRGGAVAELAYREVVRYLFEDVGTEAVTLQCRRVDGSAFAADALPSFSGAEVRGTAAAGDLLLATARLPGAVVRVEGGGEGAGTLRFPPRPLWLNARRVHGSLRLGAGPAVIAASGPLRMSLELSLAGDVEPALVGRLGVVGVLLDRSGKEVGSVPIASGRLGRMEAAVPVDASPARIRFDVSAEGIPLVRSAYLTVLRPGNDLDGLTAAGESLFLGGERVVLACRPLEPLPSVGGMAGAEGLPLRIGILDDFLTTQDAPGAMLLPEQTLGRDWPVPPAVFRESVVSAGEGGVRADVDLFRAFARLLELRPDVVVLAAGAADARRGRRPEEVCQRLLFLAQASAAAGADPVLVALPGLPAVPVPFSKRNALLCKELAWHLRTAVVDAHSRDLLDHGRSDSFLDQFATPGRRLPLSVPNDQGRRWLYALLDETVAERSRTGMP